MRRLFLPAAVCAVAISIVAVVNAGGKTQSTTTLRFDEKSTLFKVIDNPPADAGQNPETGDTVVFTGDLMSGSTKVGHDRGYCTVIDAPNAECTATFFFNRRGSIGGSDSFNFASSSTQHIAIMGGTGRYRGARGQASVKQVLQTLARWVAVFTR